MPEHREIRAQYDAQTVTVYQAYRAAIAVPAVENGRFVEPFSLTRMTWIKPSFLWMMERSGYGQKHGQEHVLAIKIRRDSFEKALSMGVLTSFDPSAHPSRTAWETGFADAKVHVQWDPERSIRGQKLAHRSIQIGISRHVIAQFVDESMACFRLKHMCLNQYTK
ncbi:MAG: DUF4291 domain-containing protein [Micrococcales bacterium]|nr:DUF4291 domain-containing protein [Micrococcales bacterium]